MKMVWAIYLYIFGGGCGEYTSIFISSVNVLDIPMPITGSPPRKEAASVECSTGTEGGPI